MKSLLLPAIFLSLFLTACSGLRQNPSTMTMSQSKLGPHILRDIHDPAVETLLAANPKVAKWVLPLTGAIKSLQAFKFQCSECTTILRVWVPPKVRYDLKWDVGKAAKNFWKQMIKQGLPESAPVGLDWLEGPNEFDNFPADRWFDEAKNAQWFATFWSALADIMNAHGYHPNVGSFVAGQPTVEGLRPLAKVMKAKKYAWSWGYHSYTLDLTKDLAKEQRYTFYYRELRDACGLQGIPLVLSEGGFLHPTPNAGWNGTFTADAYLDWLKWFDREIQKDQDVVGLTIFQVGNKKDFASFDLAPLAKDLASYLKER